MKKRKINIQKIFCFFSFVFLATCVLWYGGRTIYFYLDNNKTATATKENLAQTIINQNLNTDNLKSISGDYYFYKDVENNYIMYSNILWRIIKITSSKETVLIAENPITILAYGENQNFEDSYINKWLNTSDDDTGILEQNLNNKETYLTKTKTCLDNIENVEEHSCQETTEENYIGLLSLTDYINTGANDSFINNGQYTYLSNTNEKDEIWYINDQGKVDTNDGTDLYGIKPIITLSSNNTILSGTGKEEDPYIIEEETALFGSYVKLDEDIWRIYQVNEEEIKLVLNDYLTIDDEKITYIYSNNNYYHNDTTNGSLAYYLNQTYLNQLSYKNIIAENTWINYYYGSQTNYDYTKVLNSTIETKVSMLSIGNIILNNELDNYYTNTGTSPTSNKVYTINANGTASEKTVTLKANIVPCISLNKNLLTKGSGTLKDPYETE